MPNNPNLNPWMTMVSGRYDNLVFRRVRGKVVIARASTKPPKDPTPAQVATQLQFKLAAGYAKGVIADPVRRQAYVQAAEAQQRPLFGVIMADFLKPPVVAEIKLGDYHGQVGDPIRVMATDDVGVVSVHVRILRSDSTVLEEGPATLVEGAWVYTAKMARPSGQTLTIEATAEDRPKNKGQQFATYP